MPSQAELGALEFVTSMLEVSSQCTVGPCSWYTSHCLAPSQDIAMYINATKGDFESMRGIEEVEQTLVDYRGPSLLECGRYHLDGELRFKQVDTGGQPKSSKCVWLSDSWLSCQCLCACPPSGGPFCLTKSCCSVRRFRTSSLMSAIKPSSGTRSQTYGWSQYNRHTGERSVHDYLCMYLTLPLSQNSSSFPVPSNW